MKANRFTVLISAAMLAASPVVGSLNAANPVSASAVKKSYTGTKVSLKGKAPLYKIQISGNKVQRITPLKYRGRQLAYSAKKAKAFWKIKKGSQYYYFIGNSKIGKKTAYLALKSNAFKGSTVKVPTLNQYAEHLKAKSKVNIPIKHLAFDGYTNGTVERETPYWIRSEDSNKFGKADGNLAQGTNLKIMFVLPDTLASQDGQKADAYIANYNDQMIMVPAFAVKADGNVRSQQDYEDYLKNYQAKDKEYIDLQVKLAKEELAKK